jgi:cob(I)alamin adenosyltransferase
LVKLNKIYTRTGDDGTTGLVDGSRVAKDSAVIHAIGEVDELNSLIGVVLTHTDTHANGLLHDQLRRVQNELFDLGADIATPAGIEGALRIVQSQIDRLESEIDAWNAELQPLSSFVLPAGRPLAAALHVARTAARRAERALVGAQLGELPRAYLNRLSDWLFTAARRANDNGQTDILWVPGQSR